MDLSNCRDIQFFCSLRKKYIIATLPCSCCPELRNLRKIIGRNKWYLLLLWYYFSSCKHFKSTSSQRCVKDHEPRQESAVAASEMQDQGEQGAACCCHVLAGDPAASSVVLSPFELWLNSNPCQVCWTFQLLPALCFSFLSPLYSTSCLGTTLQKTVRC